MPPKKKRKRRIVKPESRTKFIIKKRNAQMSMLIGKLRDARTYTQLFTGLTELHNRYNLRTDPAYVEVMIYASEHSFFSWSEIEQAVELEKGVLEHALRTLIVRRWLSYKLTAGRMKHYYISSEGTLFVQNFIKEGTGVVIGIIKK